MKLIDKDKVVEEIDKRMSIFNEEKVKKEATQIDRLSRLSLGARIAMLKELKVFINTLEVKEVDLEKEIELTKGDYEQVDVAWNNDFDYIARHFFELGLKAKKG